MFDELGDTPENVAESLKRLGIQGVRDTMRILNPVVRYAKTQLAGNLDMNVFDGKTLRVVFPDGKRQDIPLPNSVIAFLDGFNNGKYPDLESPF